METITYRTASAAEAIIFATYKDNIKVKKACFLDKFANKSLHECITYLVELEELSSDNLIKMIEETHKYHLQNYKQIQNTVNSFLNIEI